MFEPKDKWRSSESYAFISLLLLWYSYSQAGSIAVSALRATLSASHSVIAFTVTNSSKELTVVQLEMLSWSKKSGEDIYSPTQDVIATLAIFTLAAGV